jgi:hypothetical protein
VEELSIAAVSSNKALFLSLESVLSIEVRRTGLVSNMLGVVEFLKSWFGGFLKFIHYLTIFAMVCRSDNDDTGDWPLCLMLRVNHARVNDVYPLH